MPSDSIAPDDAIIVISSDEEDMKDEPDVRERSDKSMKHPRESRSHTPQNFTARIGHPQGDNHASHGTHRTTAASTSGRPPTHKASDDAQAGDTRSDLQREIEGSESSSRNRTQVGGTVGVRSKLKEEQGTYAVAHPEDSKVAEVHAPKTQPRTVGFHDYWRRTEAAQSRVSLIDRRGATLGARSQRSALDALVAKYATIPASYPQAASSPHRSPSARQSSSTTLTSEPRTSSITPADDSSPEAPRNIEDDEGTYQKTPQQQASVCPAQPEGSIGRSSPTPSDVEVDGLLQGTYDDNYASIQARAMPFPPASPPQLSPSPATAAYVIPSNVPWRQSHLVSSEPFSTFIAWEQTAIPPPKPAPSQMAGVSSEQTAQGNPIVDSLRGTGLYTLSDSGAGSSQGTHSMDAHAQPPPGQVEDPVVRFLREVSLSPALAETLRAVGISDDDRIRALGALHWRLLDRLDKTMEQAGLDPVARLLIRVGLKRRAAQ